MLPLKLKCRNAAASAAASSAAPTAAYACSSFVCRPVVCLLPRSVRSCLNYDIVIIKWMHGATAATSAEAGSSSSSICCVCLIVHSRRHLMPHNVCVYVLACVCGCVCGRVCLRCNSVSKLKSSEPDEMAFNMQLNLIYPNSSSSCHRSYCSQAAADAVARCTLHACRRTAITTCHCASESA